MSLPQRNATLRGFFAILCVLVTFAFNNAYSQAPAEDMPIDPNALKNSSTSSELQSLLRDNNNDRKAGEDIHKSIDQGNGASMILKDSTQKDDIKRNLSSPDAVYGRNLFQQKQILQLSELSTPPLDYPIGVGDNIVVSLWGGADFEQSYVVARDGSIFPSGLGKITVQGLTFGEARTVIRNRFAKVIPHSTSVSVTMGQPRSIVVQVSGEVNQPGPVVVSAFTNALNIVAMAGGCTQYGNLRSILISRAGKIIDSIDVYKYLTTGDFGKHLFLENNDFIIVPFFDKKILASGQFRRPMIYQLKKEEGMQALLKYAGGFTTDAYATTGAIVRNVDEKQTIRNVDFKSIVQHIGDASYDEQLFDGDVVVINPINAGLNNKVIVRGEVAYPNVYEIRKGDRLFDVINRAGGITPNSYLERAYVYKGAGDSTNLRSDKIDVSLEELNKNVNSSYNIIIEPNDVIEVFNSNQFNDRQYVTIEGEVRKPGQIQKFGGMTLKDLIYLANGLKPSAEFGRIEVSSIVATDSAQKGLRPTKTIITTYIVKPNIALDSLTESVKLKPYDHVFVRRNPDFNLQENVQVKGEVRYQGNYSKITKGETLTSVIERAGGLTENANATGAILYRLRDTAFSRNPLYRNSNLQYLRDSSGKVTDSILFSSAEPISIDLQKTLSNKNSKYDMVLQDGDVLYIPSSNPIVAIRGAVQTPSLKLYYDDSHSNLKYYIDKAGGYSERPWRSRSYVTYANGRSKRTRNFGFLHFYPEVKQGSVIVVPERPPAKSVGNFAGQVFVTSLPIAIAFLLTTL